LKYWGFFAAKLVAAATVLGGLWMLVEQLLPKPGPILNTDLDPVGHDLGYTVGVWVFSLLATGVLYMVVWDQKYRCRTCLRRLRMPVTRGSWTHMLLSGRPHTEYICTYGHGTLKVPDVQFTGKEPIDWAEHQDIWKELELIDADRR
jgi:hypothetical protein